MYTLGADPAYGSSDWADRFCLSLWRCYADKVEQVAEFATADCNHYQFTWLMLYLAGAYQPCTYNLEVTGPGQVVLAEIESCKRLAAARPSEGRTFWDATANIKAFLFRRLDSFTSGVAPHWKTTADTKERMCGAYKDYFERGMATVRSPELLGEMKSFVREDGVLGAPGRGKDDRVIAAALALPALVTMVLLTLAWRWFPNPWTFEPRSAGADTRTDAFPRAFWWFLAASSLVALGFADWALVAFHLVQTRAIAPSTVPLVYAAAMGLDGLAALWFGRAFDRRGPAVLLVGVVAGSVFAPAVFLGTGEGWLAIGVAAWAVGMGAMDSVFKATVATLVPPDRRGAAFGLFFAVFGLAWWAGSAVLGMLYARSITTLCVVSVVAQMAAVPPLLRVARLSRQPRENPTTRNANT